MLRTLAKLVVPVSALRCAPAASVGAVRGFRNVYEGEIDFNDPETMKRYVGVLDTLTTKRATRESFEREVRKLLAKAQELPESNYRKTVEAACEYRLKVIESNKDAQAIEEVLDAHLEELEHEVFIEARMLPFMAEHKAWDVPADHTIPVVEYHDAAEFLEKKK